VTEDVSDLSWDVLGAVPDVGAAGSAAREAYYTAKLEKGCFVRERSWLRVMRLSSITRPRDS
jgi:hypothetical protein